MNFVLTDVETWVFGNVDPATGVMHVSCVSPSSPPSSSSATLTLDFGWGQTSAGYIFKESYHL